MIDALDKLVLERDFEGVGNYFFNQGYSLEQVNEEFGEYSEHKELYSLYLSEKFVNEQKSEYYVIPKFTENPARRARLAKKWIKEFHKKNGMDLPKGFYDRNKKQIMGMYHGMLKHYDISLGDILD
jgi:hypothetical protein